MPVPQTPNVSQEIHDDQDEEVIEILDDDDDIEEDNVREVPNRIKKKKVIQVKVEDESEVSALKTLGFRVCSWVKIMKEEIPWLLQPFMWYSYFVT